MKLTWQACSLDQGGSWWFPSAARPHPCLGFGLSVGNHDNDDAGHDDDDGDHDNDDGNHDNDNAGCDEYPMRFRCIEVQSNANKDGKIQDNQMN